MLPISNKLVIFNKLLWYIFTEILPYEYIKSLLSKIRFLKCKSNNLIKEYFFLQFHLLMVISGLET